MMMMMMVPLLLRLQQTEKSVDLASYYSGEGGAWVGGWRGGRTPVRGEELLQLVKQFLEPELI